ncbi:MAG: DNA primase [Eubacterium sp.]
MAPRYSEEVIQQVLEASDIVDVVSEYVALKKTGSSYKGKCPFHNERTASFSVSQEKQLYHCFGCGVGGNVMGFIMAIENLPFIDAVQFLARRANIMLPEQGNSEEDNKRYRQKERLYELHRELANYYYVCLRRSREAQYYLNNRGISAETIKAYGLGLSPDGWSSALDFLRQKGYTDQEMLDSGLVMASDKGGRLYDRFRNRIMFPILNATGRIIGFGGRRISDEDKGPKYLNSPETMIFSKGTELFNMNHAKSHIKGGQVLIVEGYMDVISLYQKDVRNTVAALGTAFTVYHAALLGRYVNEVVLCFDGDAAGEGATQKAIDILKNTAINVRILRLPVEDDPDSYIQKNGKEAFEKKIEEAITIVEYEMGLLRKRYDINQTDGRIKYINQAIVVLRQLSDEVEVDLYSKRLSRETGIDLKVIRREVYRKKPQNLTPEEVGEKVDYWQKLPKAFEEAQIMYLRKGILEPEYLVEGKLVSEHFSPGFFRELFELINDLLKRGEAVTPSALMNYFEDTERVKPVSAFLMDEKEINQAKLDESIKIIKYYYHLSEMEKLKNKIDKTDDVEEAAALMDKMVALKKDLNVN